MATATQDSAVSASSKVVQHSPMAKFMHWGTIVVFLYFFSKQLDEVEELESFSLLLTEMLFAVVFLALLLGRYLYMHSTRPTALPAETPRQVKAMARLVHLGMYCSLASIAMTGMMIGSLYWSGIKSGLIMEVAVVLHETAVWTSGMFIGIHVLAALYHRLRADGIWSSMVPVWKE